jgi:hypothetical protein
MAVNDALLFQFALDKQVIQISGLAVSHRSLLLHMLVA